MHYFAYGSNLRTAQMLARCPSAKVVQTATLRGWRLGFGGYSAGWRGAVATVIKDAPTDVPGVVYQIHDPKDVRMLDTYEGAPHVYACKRVKVTLADGTRHKVWTYVKNDPRPGTPSKDYALAIAAGLRELGLEVQHLAEALLNAGFSRVTLDNRPILPTHTVPVFRSHVDERPRTTVIHQPTAQPRERIRVTQQPFRPGETRPRFPVGEDEELTDEQATFW